ncbi:MAG: hypothetical protein QOC82_331 [Frankiaceae bacterium]|jgi:uncharacterized membrane protein YgcG|nr:hypothetical protein [Frankiaceae bacterium]
MFAVRGTRRAAHRAGALATTTLLVTGVLAAIAAPVYAVAPKVPTKLPNAIENLSPYQPQTTCAPIARPGVVKFRSLVLATYAGTGDSGIVRACSVGGTSEHKEGRAWDWRVSVKSPTQVKQVNALFAWLFATDAHGNRYAMARRLGIMYIIWNKRIWGAYSASSGWRPYSCSGVTGCHQDHVHFSFNWAGAKALTSFWTRTVANVGGGTSGGGTGGGGTSGGGDGYTGGTGGTGGTSTALPPGAPPLLSDQRLPRAIAVTPTADRVTSSFSLTGGHHYSLTVTGVYTYRLAHDGTPVLADAGCSQQRNWDNGEVTTTWTPTVPEAGQWADTVYHLAVGHDTGWHPTAADSTGCNTATHTYRMSYTPWRSGPLTFSVLDYDRSDDSGKLIVTVSRAGS